MYSLAPSEAAQQADQTDAKEDSEKLMPCPYDSSHQIRPSRFPYHIIKCRKNHPQLASELKMCPFNARHLFRLNDMPRHVATCPDRKSFCSDRSENAEEQRKWQVPVSNWIVPPAIEDWDAEANSPVVPFVWGRSLNSDSIRETSNLSNEPDLSSSVRTPKVFPWSAEWS